MASSGSLQSPGVRPDSRATSGAPPSTRSRAHSITSDRASTVGYGTALSPPSNIEPMPVYIAASAASQIVTVDHETRHELWADEHGIEPSADAVEIAPGALRLVNTFLDQLLFSFLAQAKSTSLAALRPAVADVLKPKLAKEAITNANAELNEYLGGAEEDDSHDGLDSNGEWDLELVWKRTRLRCMVYSALGDMEEDDEDRYTDLEELDGPSGSSDVGIVSPAVAIFLTSILEHMGEQALKAAGQAAYHRVLAKQRKEEKDGATASPITARIQLQDGDMERVALDRTLGRIWRGWKKRVRTNESVTNIRESFSLEAMRAHTEGRRSSVQNEPHSQQIREDEVETKELPEANIPLPVGENDVNEIEVPGLANYSDDEEEAEEDQISNARPKSMMIFTSNKGLPTPNSSQPSTPKFLSANSRKRSYSLPSPAQSNFSAPLKRQKSSLDGALSTADEASKSASHSRNVSTDSQPQGVSVASVAASAMAIGAAAVAGIVAVAKGEAPQTTPMVEEDQDLGEVSDSEVEIMTSSRISIGSPLDLVTNSQPPSGKSSRSASVRSRRGSVASARIIDVPRSPAPRGDEMPPIPGMTRRVSGGHSISAPSSPDGVNPRIVGILVPRAATTTPTIKVPSPLNREVPQPAESSIRSQASDTAPRVIAVPDRSPLRQHPPAAPSSKYEMSPEQAQFAQGVKQEEPAFVLATAPPRRSPREVKEGSTQPANFPTISGPPTNGYPRIHTPTSQSVAPPPPLTPLREMVEALDTSDDDTFGMSSTSSRMERPYPSRTVSSKARASPPNPYLRDGESTPKPEVSAKGTRQGRQSGSSSSSVTSYKPRPVRTSEDSATSPKIGHSMGKSFDDLIRSETTLQYTLTPQSMRNIQDVPPSPNQAKTLRPRTTSNNSSTKATGFLASEAPPLPSPAMTQMSIRSNGSRMNAAPRDARVENDSITDFADFIRSTGPPKGRDSLGSPNTLHAPGSRGYTPSGLRANSSAPRSIPITSAASVRTTSSAGRARLQARDAVVQADATSDLIDFIRQGPQAEGPRISRTVAPFRTTMDSDQMSAHRHRLSTLPEVRDSVITSVSVTPSMQSSTGTINSNTGLLNASQKMGGAAKAPPPALFSAFPEEEDMMPKRTRRRIRDPYAIDFSDEEDDDELFNDMLIMPAPKPKRQEESLMDFLNSVPPPPPPQTMPFMLGNESFVTAPEKKKEKRGFWGMRRKVAA